MKKKWLESMGLADIEYVDEASPDKNYRKFKWYMQIASAAVACMLVLVCAHVLFVPKSVEVPSVSKYSDSEYYELIEKLNVINYKAPKYKNNFELLLNTVSGFFSLGAKGEDMSNAPAMGDNKFENSDGTSEPGEANGTYNEVTDNQVEGVIELDRIKRSDEYIFYFDSDKLCAYNIAGEETELIGSYSVNGGYLIKSKVGFYLSNDCNTVTLVIPRYRTEYAPKVDSAQKYSDSSPCVEILSLDVSNPRDIKESGRFVITGNYITSRSIDGEILLLSEFCIEKSKLDFANIATFVPRVMKNGEWNYMSVSDIVIPENLSELRYTVLMRLNQRTLEPDASCAFLSYSSDAYITKSNVYLTHGYLHNSEQGEKKYSETLTDITSVNYTGDRVSVGGTVTVRGYVKDQYSFDEYDGILRVVTTTNRRVNYNDSYGVSFATMTSLLKSAVGVSNASLYCISTDTFEVVASVIDFAPDYEEVRSVRFDKEIGYVCTSVEVSDPVFFFDLSDVNNITYKDTGTIEGYSSSLVNIGNGYLLGIGRESWSSFKVEVYEDYSEGVRSVCEYVIKNADYSEDYKSYYVDRERGFIGIGVTDYNEKEGESRYILLAFNGYDIYPIINVALKGDNLTKRGVLIDEYMYMFASDEFKVVKIS